MEYILLSASTILLTWAVCTLINVCSATKKCLELLNSEPEWYWKGNPGRSGMIFDYYSPYSWRNLFGLRSLFIPFKIPTKDK